MSGKALAAGTSANPDHQGKAGSRVLNSIVQDATKSFLVWPDLDNRFGAH